MEVVENCLEVFCKKRCVKNFAKFTRKHLLPESLLRPVILLKKETLANVFSCEFCEIFKKTFSYRIRLVSDSAYTMTNEDIMTNMLNVDGK